MKFVDMLSTIVDNIHSPDFIFKKIAELAPMHHRLGVRAAHMEPMGRLLLVVFDTGLGGLAPEEKEAWNFLWEYMTLSIPSTSSFSFSSRATPLSGRTCTALPFW